MSDALASLTPPALWKNFKQLLAIPRPSKHEEKVLTWLKGVADQLNLQYDQDKIGNLVIRRPGTGGGQNSPPVLIQAHVDMVTEKNADIQHDFFKDPISVFRDGEWITAKGTTLGADNGIGASAAISLLQMPTSAKLPPLECLFTVDEETGLTGAKELDGSMIKAKTMLNLDTEEWGSLYIGSAGGGDSVLTLPLQYEPLPSTGKWNVFKLKCSGLLGGHSGINIGEGRCNSVRVMGLILHTLQKIQPSLRVSDIVGGNKRNAIARESSSLIFVESKSISTVERIVSAMFEEFKTEYGGVEKGLSISLSEVPKHSVKQLVLKPSSTESLIGLLCTLPHGVIRMSTAVEGLVETSSNMASVEIDEKKNNCTIICSTRSSHTHALNHIRTKIQILAKSFGCSKCFQPPAYPGWAPNVESKVLNVTKKCFKEMTGKEAGVQAIHAGLECGIISERCKGLDIVSFGPTIRGAHSPDEKVEISTVKPFFDLTLRVLEELAK